MGLEQGAVYTLIGPDGHVAVFNDAASPYFVGFLTAPPGGLDSPDVRGTTNVLAQADGGYHGSYFHGYRPLTLEGIIPPDAGVGVVNDRIERLQRASAATYGDGALLWTESGEAYPRAVRRLRRAQPLRVTDTRPKRFQLQMVGAEHLIRSGGGLVNVIENPSAEINFDGWDTFDAGAWSAIGFTRSAAWSPAGNYSGRLLATHTGAGAGEYIAAHPGRGAIAGGRVYSGTAALKVIAGAPSAAWLKLVWYAADDSYIGESLLEAAEDPAGELVFSGVAPAPAGSAWVRPAVYLFADATTTIEAHVDAFAVVESAAELGYFDGDTASAGWSGVPHASTSELGLAAAGGIANTAPAVVVNDGNAAVHPTIIWTPPAGVDGAENASFENLTTGQALNIGNVSGIGTIEYIAGVELALDLEARTFTVGGLDKYGDIDYLTSAWWELVPGPNLVQITDANGKLGAFRVRHYHGWL